MPNTRNLVSLILSKGPCFWLLLASYPHTRQKSLGLVFCPSHQHLRLLHTVLRHDCFYQYSNVVDLQGNSYVWLRTMFPSMIREHSMSFTHMGMAR